MPLERQNQNPLTGVLRLLLSRGAHLVLGFATVCAVLFCGYDATRTRPSDGTVWLLGRPELEVLDLLPVSTPTPTPLQPGDLIVGIGRRIVNSPQTAAEELRRYEPGAMVPYLVRRGREQLNLPVTLGTTRVDLRDYSVNVVLALVYLVIGFAVYLRGRPRAGAQPVLRALPAVRLYFMTNLQQVSYFLGALITQNIGAFARFMLPAVFLHFFLVFPRKKLTLTRHPFLAPLLYLLPWMFYFRFTLDQFIGAEGAKIDATSWIVLGLYYVCGLGALLHGYFSYRDPLMRQRVRILTFGTLAAVIPFLIFKIGLEELSFQTGLTRLGAVPLAAIPISLRLLRGPLPGAADRPADEAQPGLRPARRPASGSATWASPGGWAARLLALVPGASPLVAAGRDPGRRRGAVAAAPAACSGPWTTGSTIRATTCATLIEEFSQEIPRLIQREALLERVGRRLCVVLDLPGLAMYLTVRRQPGAGVRPGRPDHRSRPGAARTRTSCRRPNRPPTRPACTCAALAPLLEEQGEPFWVDPGDASELELRQAITREQAELKARAREQQFLAGHGIQLLIPMVTQGRLVGLVALPGRPRRRGLPGARAAAADHRGRPGGPAGREHPPLRGGGGQAEAGRGDGHGPADPGAAAAAARSRPSPASEIEAVNISSKQVSGDYYDMIEREDGRLAIVIADVSGKGMPASILASNIQAALRAQCDTCDSPGEVLERINRQIHASTDPQHFATLFLAMFDPVARQLLYSSGGHNPPVLMRADGTVELLEKGGLPLGAFDFGTYDEETVDAGARRPAVHVHRRPDRDQGPRRGRGLRRGPPERPAAGAPRRCRPKHLRGDRPASCTDFSGRKDADDDITMVGLKVTAEVGEALAGAGGR